MSFAHALDWKTWFEPIHFMDVFAIPISVGIAASVVCLSKTNLFKFLLKKTIDNKNPIIQLKEFSGLKIYSLWNLCLACGLMSAGLLYKDFNITTTAYVSFYGASLGWAYAFGYFAESWPEQEKVFKKILIIFLCVAILEKLLGMYWHSKIEIKQLFFYTIPPLVLLLYAVLQRDNSVFAKMFWLSSFLFNLTLVGIFCIDGLREIGLNNSSSITPFLLVIAPIVAIYVSLICYKKHCCPVETRKLSKTTQVLALLFIVGIGVLIFQGINKASEYIVEKKSENEGELNQSL
jgi:hypothetical protein